MQEASLDPIVYPIVVCVGTLVVLLLVLTYAITATMRKVSAHYGRTLEKWQKLGIQFVLGPQQASFLNQRRSFGPGGNGTLLLSRDAVRFAQVSPDREIVIRFEDISQVGLADKFNGRWGGGPFLVIKRNVGDLTGFQIPEPQKWVDAIDAALGSTHAGATA